MATIIGTQGLGYDVGDQPRGEYAFEHEGTAYVFLRQSTLTGDRKVYAFSTSDDGATWTDHGAADFVTEDTAHYTVAHDGDTAYLLILETSGPGDHLLGAPAAVKLFTFGLTSHTWSSATTFGSGPGAFVDFEYSGNVVGEIHVLTALMRLLVRGPGDCVFYYSGAPTVSGGRQYSKLYTRTFNGTTFGTPQALPDQDDAVVYNGQGGCVDSAGNCHLLYSSGNTVLHVGLSPLDAFGTVWVSPSVDGELDFSYMQGLQGDIAEPLAYQDGSGESVGFALWVGRDTGQFIGFFHGTAALSPTFSYQEIIQEDDASSSFSGYRFAPENNVSPNNQGFQLLNGMFCLVKAVAASGADHLCIAWTNTQSTDDIGWTGARGYAQRLKCSAADLVWTFDTPIVAGDFAEQPFLPANSVIGLSGPGAYAIILLSEEGEDFTEEALGDFTRFAAAPPTITCGDPPDGMVGEAYSHTMPVTHSGDTFTVEITDGALPDGLTMSEAGEITGTPTVAGDFPFEATVTDEGAGEGGTGGVPGTAVTLPLSRTGWDMGFWPGGTSGLEYNDNQYIFLVGGAELSAELGKLHALKSTDGGATWSSVASLTFPTAAYGVDWAYTTCRDGSLVHLMAANNAFTHVITPVPPPLYTYTFDLETDTFSAPSTSVLVLGQTQLNLVRRGAGDMFLLFNSPDEGAYHRVSIVSFDGSSFGSPVLIPGQSGLTSTFNAACAEFDSSGILHIVLHASGGIGEVFMHVGMDSGGSFGSPQTVETQVGNIEWTSRTVEFGSEIGFLGIHGGLSDELELYHAPSGSLAPTWTTTPISTSVPVVNDSRLAEPLTLGLAYLDGFLHVFWATSGTTPDWDIGSGNGQVIHRSAAISDLTTWSAEDVYLGPFDDANGTWGLSQISVWAGPSGLGVLADACGFDPTVAPELSRLIETSAFRPMATGATGTDVVECSITIDPIPAPTIECGSPPAGTVGLAYEHELPTTHHGSFTVAITAGDLPVGLSMATTGLITGVPTTVGIFPFTATISADALTDEVDCSITINPLMVFRNYAY